MLKASKAKKAEAKDAALQKKADTKATKKAGGAAGAPEGAPSRHPFIVAAKGIASVRDALLPLPRRLAPEPRLSGALDVSSWSDIEDLVRADVERFGLDADGEIVREPDGSATYTGRVFGLYTEVYVQPGEEPSVFVEVD